VPYVGGKTSLTIAETSGVPTSARLLLYAESGTLLRAVDVGMDGGQSVSYADLLGALSLDAAAETTAVVENVSGGLLAVTALREDPGTGDAFAVSGVPLP